MGDLLKFLQPAKPANDVNPPPHRRDLHLTFELVNGELQMVRLHDFALPDDLADRAAVCRLLMRHAADYLSMMHREVLTAEGKPDARCAAACVISTTSDVSTMVMDCVEATDAGQEWLARRFDQAKESALRILMGTYQKDGARDV